MKIEFTGLKDGLHTYQFEIGDEFFVSFENSLISKGHLHLDVEFEKGANLYTIAFKFEGQVELSCAMCGSEYLQDIAGNSQFFVKFSEEDKLEAEEVLVLHPNDFQIDIGHRVYEVISLALPLNGKHEDQKDCDQDVIQRLYGEYLVEEEEKPEVDPRWEMLKSIKGN